LYQDRLGTNIGKALKKGLRVPAGTNASADPLYVDGHKVYSAYFEGGMGFRNQVFDTLRFGPRFGPTGSGQTNTSRTRENSKKRDAFFSQDTQEIAVGDEPETIYMVTSGTHYNNECCFDYGNAEVSTKKRPPFLVQQLPA
jgi:hypothetical protein